MESNHIKAFEKLMNRQATPAEAKRLEEIRYELGLTEDDAVWLIFIGLEYYLSLYKAQSSTIEYHVDKSIREAVSKIPPAQEPVKKFSLVHIAFTGAIFGSTASLAFFLVKYLFFIVK